MYSGYQEKFAGIRYNYQDLRKILMDKKLAKLGDAYVNFVYSLALTEIYGEPTGARVSSEILAKALKKAHLRKLLPSRLDRHSQGDAAEALIVYAWLQGAISLKETVKFITACRGNYVEAFTLLLEEITRRVKI
jgi:hypothetical protein